MDYTHTTYNPFSTVSKGQYIYFLVLVKLMCSAFCRNQEWASKHNEVIEVQSRQSSNFLLYVTSRRRTKTWTKCHLQELSLSLSLFPWLFHDLLTNWHDVLALEYTQIHWMHHHKFMSQVLIARFFSLVHVSPLNSAPKSQTLNWVKMAEEWFQRDAVHSSCNHLTASAAKLKRVRRELKVARNGWSGGPQK